MNRIARRLGCRVLRAPRITETFDLYRRRPGYRRADGTWDSAGFEVASVRGLSLPVEGEERLVLPEGLRESEVRQFTIAVKARAIGQQSEGDLILHKNKFYRVVTALLHDSTAARVGALFQLLVQDTTAQDFGLPSSAIRLRM